MLEDTYPTGGWETESIEDRSVSPLTKKTQRTFKQLAVLKTKTAL